jgi:hypothetical protein
MSNPIGAGTANITYNGPQEESAILGRKAFELGVSRGELLRDLVLRGLREMDAVTAKQVDAIRSERLRMKHGVACLLVGIVGIGLALAGNIDLRRSPRGRRVEWEEAV